AVKGPPEMPEPPQMRWWGWGDEARPTALDARTLALLRDTTGVASTPRPPVALDAVRLPRARLRDTVGDALRRVVGADGVRDDRRERVAHAAGKGYVDLVRLRAGTPAGAPDAVVLPASHEQVRAVLELCARGSLAVVPFGGGTSVVGGVEPLRGAHEAAIALDMRRLSEVRELDGESRIVTAGAGMRGPALERWLAAQGLTLGHWPQSFEYVSLGGCVATRSAGQASSGYGGIAKMVLGLRLAAPAGDIELQAMPASAAGPGLRELLVGSEGVLGVIDEVALRVRRAPGERIYEGVFFESFGAGLQALRALAQEHAMPEVARLSDARETSTALTLAGDGGIKGWLGGAYLGLRGYGQAAEDRCLAIFGFEGEREEVRARRERARGLARAHGGLAVGRAAGEAWRRGRFEGPYLRDELLTQGVMVETLETATRWSGVERLHGAVQGAIERALREQGTPGIVMCHVSHLYETGASLYFTFIASQREGAEIEQWQAVKRAASGAIVAEGGTITHHHAVGRDHAPWLQREVGAQGVAAIGALKAELDPAGIMNPGKLLP
ncbi:MAG TPA: FAD-binding oxidoreductase, partial [Solirubrobacteraceae bacterium]|nr:FAD-binding oxidoreductase [Solirubrobacteraceae bacterium]